MLNFEPTSPGPEAQPNVKDRSLCTCIARTKSYVVLTPIHGDLFGRIPQREKKIPAAYVELKTSKLEKYISDAGVTALPGCVVTREDTITHRKAPEKLSQNIVSWEAGGN